MTLAIVSAMREELRALLPLLAGARVQRCAARDFHVGELAGRPAVLALLIAGSRRSAGRSARMRPTASRTSLTASAAFFSSTNSTLVETVPSRMRV